MHNEFFLGLLIGCLINIPFSIFVYIYYRRILLNISKANICEKLPDGKFYYIVPETEWLKMISFELLNKRKEEENKLFTSYSIENDER